MAEEKRTNLRVGSSDFMSLNRLKTDFYFLSVSDVLMDSFQYAGEVLQFFPHVEVYVRATPGGLSTPGGPPPNSYIYE